MFSSLGFISLGEIIDKFAIDWSRNLRNSEDENIDSLPNPEMFRAQNETRWRLGEYFSRQPSFSVCLPSGGAVRVAANFLNLSALLRNEFSHFHPCLSRENYYISLEFLNGQIEKHERWYRKNIWEKNDGHVGDDPNNYRRVVRMHHMKALAKRFAPLVGGSLQVAIAHAPNTASDLSPASDVAPVSDAQIIAEIMHLSGSGVRRDDIRRTVGPDLPVDVWRSLWKEAAKIMPEISKSGPKKAQFGS